MEQLLFKAKLAERAERFSEMTELMTKVVHKAENDISFDIRNLVSVAYKNHIGELRTSWRLLNQIEDKEKAKGLEHGAQCVKEYRQEIEKEIIQKCDEVIGLVDKMLTSTLDLQARTFLLQMKADYNRYMAELPTDRKQQAIDDASRVYEDALKVGLSSEHHVMLGVQLNKAIFYYEVLDRKSDAIKILEEQLSHLNVRPSEDNRRNLPAIVNLIDDNLKLWKAGRK